MGPIFDPKDLKKGPRTAQAVNAEACSRECQESSALCTWPNCSCPTVQRSTEELSFPALAAVA